MTLLGARLIECSRRIFNRVLTDEQRLNWFQKKRLSQDYWAKVRVVPGTAGACSGGAEQVPGKRQRTGWYRCPNLTSCRG